MGFCPDTVYYGIDVIDVSVTVWQICCVGALLDQH